MTSYVKNVLDIVSSALDLNAATFSGAMDIIVFEDESGKLQSTPFHVRFGKLRLLKSREKVVQIEVNGKLHEDIQMKLGSAGEAYFVEETDQPPPDELCPSPLSMPSSPKTTGQTLLTTAPPIGGDPDGDVIGTAMHSSKPDPLTVDYMSDSELDRQSKRVFLRSNSMINVEAASQGPTTTVPVTRADPAEAPRAGESEENGRAEVEQILAEIMTEVLTNVTNRTQTMAEEDIRLTSEPAAKRQALMEPIVLPPSLAAVNGDARPDPASAVIQRTGDQSAEDAPVGDSEVALGERERDTTGDAVNADGEDVAPADPSDGTRAPDHELEVRAPLSISLCGHLISSEMDEAKVNEIFDAHVVDFETFSASPDMIYDRRVLLRMGDRIVHWDVAAPSIVSMLAYGVPLDLDRLDKAAASTDLPEDAKNESSISRLFNFRRRIRPPLAAGSREPVLNVPALPMPDSHAGAMPKHVRKSLRPDEEVLKKLDLKPGVNSIRFIVYSSLQGQQEVASNIYRWPSDQKIVISDVDGTITKSDVLGHVLPRMGRDWSHAGVVELFHKLISLGYNIMYLTSRPIGQADNTREYLSTLVQGELGLPQGPVVMSPDRLMKSITREVILRRPHEFKIAALRDIRLLFPPDFNPFFAGFGNRDTDFISYSAVGIPPHRIFTINPKGELNVMNANYEACGSYANLEKFVREVFPDIKGYRGQNKITEVLDGQEYNDFKYWKESLPEVDVSSLL